MKQQLLFKNSLFHNVLNWINPFGQRSIKVWGANVASLKSKGDDLKELLDKQQPDVVLLNETWLTSDSSFDHPKYLSIASDFNQKYQGTAILLRKDTNNYYSCHQVMHTNKNLTEIILRIDPENKVHFISVYAPPLGNDERDQQREEALNDFYSTVNAFKSNYKYKCIGYSDFNARLRKLIDKQDLDAKNLLKQLKSLQLKLIYALIPSSFTRKGMNFKNEVSQSYIDYFFYRDISYKKFEIRNSIGKSDHNLLQVYVKKQMSTKIWIYLSLLIIIPFLLYNKQTVHFDKFLQQIIDLIDEYFSDYQQPALIQSIIQTITPTDKIFNPIYRMGALLCLGFAIVFYIIHKFNLFFF